MRARLIPIFILLSAAITTAANQAMLADTATAPGNTQAVLTDIAGKLEQLKKDEKPPTDEMFSSLTKIVESEPTNYRARLVLGSCLDRAGLYEQAIEQFKFALQYGPTDPDGIVKLIDEQELIGLHDEAEKLTKEAVRRFPKNPRVQFWVGKQYLRKGYLPGAEKALTYALKEVPDMPGASTAMAQVRLREGLYETALKLVEKDLNKHPNSMDGQLVKGTALAKLNRWSEAFAPLKFAFERSHFNDMENVASFYASACYETRNYELGLGPAIVLLDLQAKPYQDDQTARDWFEKFAARVPNARRHQLLIEIIERGARMQDNPEMRYQLGEMLDQLGDHNLATLMYDKAFTMNPRDSRAAFRLGRNLEIYYHKYDEALTCYAKAHSLDPGNAEIGDYLMRLQNRLPERDQDLAWRLKDWLRRARSPI